MNSLNAIRAYSPAMSRAEAVGGLKGSTTPVPISELRELPGMPSIQPSGKVAESANSFGQLIGGMVSEVSKTQDAAGAALHGLLSGGNVSLHQAMIAMEEASVSFQLMVEVRNKLMESYQELMRMQV